MRKCYIWIISIALLVLIVTIVLLSMGFHVTRIDEGAQYRIKSDISSLKIAIEKFQDKYDSYPNDLSSLKEFFDKDVPKDPYGNEYIYRVSKNNEYFVECCKTTNNRP